MNHCQSSLKSELYGFFLSKFSKQHYALVATVPTSTMNSCYLSFMLFQKYFSSTKKLVYNMSIIMICTIYPVQNVFMVIYARLVSTRRHFAKPYHVLTLYLPSNFESQDTWYSLEIKPQLQTRLYDRSP